MRLLTKHCGVVICWKIRIFAYWTTPALLQYSVASVLWFAEKFVSLLIEQHHIIIILSKAYGCDLLKNSYLCLLNNTHLFSFSLVLSVVICWKIRIFAYWTTPFRAARNDSCSLWFAEKFVSLLIEQHPNQRRRYSPCGCDLLKNSYLCLLNNTVLLRARMTSMLWFAEKFVSLLIEQHPKFPRNIIQKSCDLLKNSYLCLLNNTKYYVHDEY